jgi:hypothetical protein
MAHLKKVPAEAEECGLRFSTLIFDFDFLATFIRAHTNWTAGA